MSLYQQDFVNSSIGVVAPKLLCWNKIMHREGYADFDSFSITAESTSRFAPNVEFSSDKYQLEIPGGKISISGYNFSYTFRTFFESGSTYNYKAVVLFDERISYELSELGLLAEFSGLVSEIAAHGSHDFVHSATLGTELGNDPVFQVLNSRGGNINGYEHYSLAMHQAIYVQLRQDDPTYPYQVLDVAFRLDNFIKNFLLVSDNPEKEKMADCMYEYIFYMLRNLVDGQEFCIEGAFSRDVKQWEKALIMGDASEFEPFKIYEDKKLRAVSLEELSAIFVSQKAKPEELVADFKSIISGKQGKNISKDRWKVGFLKEILDNNNNYLDKNFSDKIYSSNLSCFSRY